MIYLNVQTGHLFPFSIAHHEHLKYKMLSLGDGKENRVCLILLLSTVCSFAADICSALQRRSIFSQQKRAQ